MHLSLREYYIEADLKYSLLSIALFGTLTFFSLVIPSNVLLMYEIMLFALAFLHVTLTVDSLAWMPFAMTHTVFANGFAIPISIVSARIVATNSFAFPNALVIVALGIWWISIVLHFVTSESPLFSYFGGIERQMGMTFRLTVPIVLFASWQVLYHAGTSVFFEVMLAAAIVESVVLTLQFLDEERHIKFPWSYLKSIGFRRYTGTISNPIPVANFLVTILPLTFAFYNSTGFVFFVISYLAISWGLFLSHGRGSYIATVLITLLETIYVLFYPSPLYMIIIALAVVISPPILYLFTPQGKSTRQKLNIALDFVKRKNSKTKTANDSSDSKPVSSSVNRAFIWREAIRVFKLHPILGYGVSNIARAMRSRFSRRSSRYFMTQVIDRCHNYYLDLLIEGGITHLAVYLFLLCASIYFSIVDGMPWIAIAIVGYSVDLLFSFPLQINYLSLMLIVSVSSGLQAISYAPLSYILFAFAGIYLVNLYFSAKNNTAMRYIQLALSAQTQGDIKVTLDSALSALKAAPFEQRYFTASSNVLESLASTGKLQLEDLHTFRVWFNASKKFIIKTSEAPDVPFSTMGMVYSVVFASTKDKTYGNEAWTLIKSALKMNPTSITARRALFMLLNTLGELHLANKNVRQALLNFKQAEAALCGIVDDFLKSPVRNYDLENSYWQAYFDILKKLEMYEKLRKYFDIYKERFSAILFTYDIFTKISKTFNTPVGWTIINRNGVKILRPVNTVMGPLVKRIWKFSHGKDELYLTVGQNVKISEDAIRPFMKEFMDQEWHSKHWKSEGFVG